MHTHNQNKSKQFQQPFTLSCTRAVITLVLKKDLVPFLLRIAYAQQHGILNPRTGQLWVFKWLHDSWFQATVYNAQLETLFSMAMKSLPPVIDDLVLWYEGGVVMLSDES